MFGLSSTLSFAIWILPGVLLGDVLEHGCDHLARTAPLGPEVDEHRGVRAADAFVERCIGEIYDSFSHVRILS